MLDKLGALTFLRRLVASSTLSISGSPVRRNLDNDDGRMR
jgi:hypothetical protein